MEPTMLFLDIDGVLSIYEEQCQDRKQKIDKITCWPIPMAAALLQAIEEQYCAGTLIPIWLSCWHQDAWEWNRRAGTSAWRIGYHLEEREARHALKCFPELVRRGIDQKLVAARYHLRGYQENRVIWVEDGFASETRAWARNEPRIRLVDTASEPLRSYLLREHKDLTAAARRLVEQRFVLQA